MTDERKLPKGRIGRFARLASLGARTGVSMLTKGRKEAAAEHAAEVLGSLRGLAAKVGQMASYVDGVIPEAHRGAYETSLKALRSAAPTSSFTEIRKVIESELGAPIEELFDDFDETPFASASIGQVHRANLDGRPVAVKVQHPGISDAVEADLNNAGVLESMVGHLGARKFDSKRVFEEIKTRFREELDYELEASRQATFIELNAGDPDIHIPSVYGERSSTRVLTTELVKGLSFDEATSLEEPVRRRICETMWRFVFKGNLVGGMFNADPHPGNFYFTPDGKVTFLDFGCCQPIEGDRLKHARELHRAALERDEARFGELATVLLKTQGGTYERLAVAYSRTCFEPIFAAPFRITRTYSTSLVERMRDMKKEVFETGAKDFAPLPEGMLFLNRLQFGFYSVLARFDVEVDYADVERRFLDEAGLL